MINFKKKENRRSFSKMICWTALILSVSSACHTYNVFSKEKVVEDVTTKVIRNVTSPHLENITGCALYGDSTCVRITKKKNAGESEVREYYGECLFGIGKLANEKKIGSWTIFCNDLKVAEEIWTDDHLVLVKYYDPAGKIISILNYGPPQENF